MDSMTIPPPSAAVRAARLTPRSKVVLVVEILAAYVRVRWLLASKGVADAVTALRGGRIDLQPTDGDQLLTAIRLGRRIGRTLDVLPTDSRCLVRSCVLTSLLARRGITSTLVIGVRTKPAFAAHAWVESSGVPLLDPGSADYKRLLEV